MYHAHSPENHDDLKKAYYRLKFEIFFHAISISN